MHFNYLQVMWFSADIVLHVISNVLCSLHIACLLNKDDYS